MNRFLKITFTLFLSVGFGAAFSQNPVVEKKLETILESIAENLEDGTDVATVLEDLEELLENPVNINATNKNELLKLYLLNTIQIQNLLAYINEFGPAYSIFELNTIEGFTPELLKAIEPFIQFGEKDEKSVTFSESLNYGRHELLLRTLGTIQIPDGYQERENGPAPFQGNRFRYYSRYRFRAGNKFSAGFTAEKDPGEAFFSQSNKHGFDFYSGHVKLSFNSAFENLILGDFLVRSGQGLVLWQGYAPGKSGNVLDVSKTGQGMQPYTSVDENAFFRGAATTVNMGRNSLSFFYSQKNTDGNIVETDDGSLHFSSLQTSGYHRTKNEVDDEKSISNMHAGLVGSIHFQHIKIGTTLLYQKFDLPLIRSDQLYTLFRFSGRENLNERID